MKKIFIGFLLIIFFIQFSQLFLIADDQEMEIRRLGRLIHTGESNDIINLLLKARQDGLPVDGLLNKVREGAAKQVDVEKILNVLYTKKGYLEKTNTFLKSAEQKGLRVWSNEKEENIESLAQAMEEGVEVYDMENFVQEIIKNNEDVRYLVHSSTALSILIRAKLDRFMSKQLITMAVQKNVDVNIYSELSDFLVEARRYDYPLEEVFSKLKQGIQENKDIRGLIFDIKFSR
ncbi:hypothetical protein HZA55_04965 [Candidatus Poribacteria bacterium]|nr:hypothetical protein [Candidatus Poribacteria bacterium]